MITESVIFMYPEHIDLQIEAQSAHRDVLSNIVLRKYTKYIKFMIINTQYSWQTDVREQKKRFD